MQFSKLLKAAFNHQAITGLQRKSRFGRKLRAAIADDGHHIQPQHRPQAAFGQSFAIQDRPFR